MCEENIVSCWEEELANLEELIQDPNHVVLYEYRGPWDSNRFVVHHIETERGPKALRITVVPEVGPAVWPLVEVSFRNYKNLHHFLNSFSIYRRV